MGLIGGLTGLAVAYVGFDGVVTTTRFSGVDLVLEMDIPPSVAVPSVLGAVGVGACGSLAAARHVLKKNIVAVLNRL